MDDECIKLRPHSRMLERSYRARKLPADCLAWVEHERKRHTVYHRKESQFWSRRLSDQAGQPRKMWKTISSILGKTETGNDSEKTGLTAQNLMDFFNKKIQSVRQTTGGTPVRSSLPAATSFLDTFHTYTPDEIKKVIIMAPSKSCQLDPLPTHILKDFLPDLLPYITEICNGSLEVGRLTLSQHHAIVQPRLKMVTADAEDIKNYQPISNLTFISKVIKKLVCQQISVFLEENKLLPTMQSAYQRYHSTETAVLKIASDILRAADRGDVTFLCLLDLSAAFDTVDHDILVDRLERAFGLRELVLEWIKSFLFKRTKSVLLNETRLTQSELQCGIPQGRVILHS